MTGMARVPRSRGALSGVLLVLLGAWGALIAFIGPYFHYAYSPDHTWAYSTGRLWLEVLPGVAVFLGGLITLSAATRPAAVFGSWLATLGGAWFVVGGPLSTLWNHGVPATGYPVGSTTLLRAVENIGFFTGLGVVIVFLGAVALGRFLVIGAREAALAEAAAAEPSDVAAGPAATEPVATEPAATSRGWETPPAAGDGTARPASGVEATGPADRPAGMTASHAYGGNSAEDTEPPA
jgi:hypothetical protein